MKYRLSLLPICFLFLQIADAAILPPGFAETAVAEGLNPTGMALAPDGRLFLAQKDGRILILHADGELHAEPFLKLEVDDFNERGLQGIALHPHFDQEPWIYLYYTVPGADHNRVSRVFASGDFAVPGSEEVLLELDPLGGSVHNGGSMVFGQDENLYIGTGDGAVPANAQNMNSLLGKILCLTPSGGIPDSNPFYQQLQGPYRAIYALGARNPFSMSCDPATGRIFFCDVGNGAWEEVNELLPGKNYGWSLTEGPLTSQTPPADYQDPLFAYPHTDGCAVVGAAFGFGAHPALPPDFQGKFFFADYCKGWIKMLDPATGALSGIFATEIDRPVSLLITPGGELYYFARAGLGGGSPGDNTISTEGTLWKVFWVGEGAPLIAGQPRDVFVPEGENAQFSAKAFGAQPIFFQWFKNGEHMTGSDSSVLVLNNVSIADSGSAIVCIAANAFGSDTSTAAFLQVTANQRPQPEIIFPSANARYRCGDTLHFSGLAFDPEEGALPSGRLSWRIDFHHATHTHPALSPVDGISEGIFYVPTVGETATDVFFRVYLSAVDGAGLVKTVWRDVVPELSGLHVSGPPGLPVNIDGQWRSLPASVESVIRIERHLQATVFLQSGDTTYIFKKWSTGETSPFLTVQTPETPLQIGLEYDVYIRGNGNGLRGDYFFDPDGNLDGAPALTRLDTTVNFIWQDASPAPDVLPVDYFTVRWTGDVLPVFSDTYTFSVSSDDGCRLWVGDSLLIDKWKPQALSEHAGSITLEGGKKYPIRLEYLEVGGGASVQLYWKSALQPKEIVPKRQLYEPDTIHTAVLRGVVGIDSDLDGSWEPGETTLPNTWVRLYRASDDLLLAEQRTLSNGRYTFLKLGPGDYYLHIEPPAMSDLLEPSQNIDLEGKTPVFSLSIGENRVLNAAWVVAQTALYGTVWLDENRDDQRDPAEPGLANVAVLLYRSDSAFVSATATNSGGGYLFSLVPPGAYFLLFSKQLIALPLAPGFGLDSMGKTPAFDMKTGQGREVLAAFKPAGTSALSSSPEALERNLAVWPNPAGGSLWASLQLGEEQEVSLEIFNIAGQRILQQAKRTGPGRNTWHIPVSELKAGVYVLVCRTAKGLWARRWVKN